MHYSLCILEASFSTTASKDTNKPKRTLIVCFLLFLAKFEFPQILQKKINIDISIGVAGHKQQA